MSSTRVPAPASPAVKDQRFAHDADASAAPRGLLPVVLTATFMYALDFFIVNVAIPSMQHGLAASSGAIQWIMVGYSLALAAGLISAGRLGDIHGRRRMFALGLGLFTAASAACGLAPDIDLLVAARIAQGLAAALMAPQVLAIIRTAYQGAAQARAIALYAVTMGLGAVCGQLIGGVLIRADLFGSGWRSCFLINIPVGLAALATVRRSLPESRAPRRPRLDNTGTALITTALVALLLPLVQGRQAGWPLWTWLTLAASVVLLVVFALHQRRLAARGGSPLVPPELFRGRVFALGSVTQVIFAAGQGSFFLILALYLQLGRGLDPLASGIVFTVLALGYFASSLRSDVVAARLGRQAVTLGAVGMALGLALLWGGARVAGDAPGTARVLWLIPGLVVDGVGMGLVLGPLTGASLSRVGNHLVGAASGVITTLQQVGGAVGVALVGLVFYGSLSGGYAHAFESGVLVLAAMELTLAGLMQLLPREQ
ncbi:MFS transporter [Streptacidiphilus anmyonensis]|uniref:MFS transporter n=1 Tax=Streptacidiphilus anmyonensis TaxID=405782 RepID=UPI0009FF496E|nr:MFS transporter [Streptacidiphilus anmyonensis]